MARLYRRDFLKLSGALAAGAAVSMLPLVGRAGDSPPDKPNFIILVLDAMAARNLSLYGYARDTTPNLRRLAARSTVYHSHYSAGNFTTPGTASMLMGVYPWLHRGINLGGLVHQEFVEKTIFHFLKDEYYREAWGQNYYANVLLEQFIADLDRRLPVSAFSLEGETPLLEKYFPRDAVAAYYGLDKYGFLAGKLPSAPLFSLAGEMGNNTRLKALARNYPYNIPSNLVFHYENKAVFDGVLQEILDLHGRSAPYLSYFHLYSPHEPYAPRREFVDIFSDIEVPVKRPNKFSSLDIKPGPILQRRKEYDEYVANVDYEIGRLIDRLEAAGVLENSYIFVTSDHGELFERGEYGHVTRFLYEGVIHIPLLVMAPGQTTGQDVRTRTSNIDLVPTILALAGKSVPAGLDGQLLPGLGGAEDPNRSIFSVEAKESSSFGTLPHATVTLIKGDYKLIYYTGYKKLGDVFELYNLREDPEEMKNLFSSQPDQAGLMKTELLDTFEAHRALHV